jgi:predicted dehydrogenase
LHDAGNPIFALTHNYTGYPMVKEAREIVRSGEIGDIMKLSSFLYNPERIL